MFTVNVRYGKLESCRLTELINETISRTVVFGQTQRQIFKLSKTVASGFSQFVYFLQCKGTTRRLKDQKTTWKIQMGKDKEKRNPSSVICLWIKKKNLCCLINKATFWATLTSKNTIWLHFKHCSLNPWQTSRFLENIWLCFWQRVSLFCQLLGALSMYFGQEAFRFKSGQNVQLAILNNARHSITRPTFSWLRISS